MFSPENEKNDPRIKYLSEWKKTDVLVIFVDHTDCKWLKWLKPGFRHCFVALNSGGQWIVCDSLKNKMEIEIFDFPDEFNLARFYLDQGYTVLSGLRIEKKMSKNIKMEITTCVTIVKRLIGLECYWILTPWRLFCFLKNPQNNIGRWRLIK